MKKISDFIVRFGIVLLVLFIAGAGMSVYLMRKVNINFDFTLYLSETSATRIGLEKMEAEFGKVETVQLRLDNIDPDGRLTEDGRLTLGAELAASLSKLDGISIASINSLTSDKNGLLIQMILDPDRTVSDEAVLDSIRGVCDGYTLNMSGSIADTESALGAMDRDMAIILGVAVAVILIILTLTSTSWIDPVIFIIVLGLAILVNLGTNVIFSSISYITYSICVVLQLALCMDYSIMMLHRFNEELSKNGNAKQSASLALKNTFVSVLASSLTTIAGMLALTFMTYRLGFDIGMVLAKGVVISLLTVFLIMPILLVLFSPLIKKTKHKTLHAFLKEKLALRREKKAVANKAVFDAGLSKKLKKTRTFSDFQFASRKVLPAALCLLIIAGAVIQSGMDFSYTVTMSKNAPEPNPDEIQNQLVIMLPREGLEKTDRANEKAVAALLLDYTQGQKHVITGGVGAATSGLYDSLNAGGFYDKFFKSMRPESVPEQIYRPAVTALIGGIISSRGQDGVMPAYELFDFLSSDASVPEYIAAPVKETYQSALESLKMVENDKYTRLLFNLECFVTSAAAFEAIEYITSPSSGIGKYYDEYYILSESLNFYDIRNEFASDTAKVNLISFFLIFLIILISFRSVSIPAILTLLIQGAIWITMALNTVFGSPIFFICYLVAMCIQMGATVDYAILMTSRYMAARKRSTRRGAIDSAFDSSITTVLTSGMILVIAAFIVGAVSNLPMISSLGYLLSLGCLLSVLLVVFGLPQLLLLCDKLIEKTTLKPLFYKKPPSGAAETATETAADALEKTAADADTADTPSGDSQI